MVIILALIREGWLFLKLIFLLLKKKYYYIYLVNENNFYIGIEDYNRHKSDQKLNSSKCTVLLPLDD